MMASAQVVETSVNTNNSPSEDYTTNPDDHSNHNITVYVAMFNQFETCSVFRFRNYIKFMFFLVSGAGFFFLLFRCIVNCTQCTVKD